MVKVEVGEICVAHRVRSGSSEKGSWELIAIKGKGGDRREVTFYVMNHPSNIREGEPFYVDDIQEVQVNAMQDEDGNWTKTRVSMKGNVHTALPVDPVGDLGYDVSGGLI